VDRRIATIAVGSGDDRKQGRHRPGGGPSAVLPFPYGIGSVTGERPQSFAMSTRDSRRPIALPRTVRNCLSSGPVIALSPGLFTAILVSCRNAANSRRFQRLERISSASLLRGLLLRLTRARVILLREVGNSRKF